VVYRYGRYRCSFHVTKGPAVCSNSMSIRQDVLDGRLLDKFNGALTPEMIDYLVTATNQVLQQPRGATPQEIETLTAERQVVERELSNLVEFVIKGVLSSSRLREDIRAREQRLAELDRGLEQLRAAALPAPRRINLGGRTRSCASCAPPNRTTTRRRAVEEDRNARPPRLGPGGRFRWLRGLDMQNATRSLLRSGLTLFRSYLDFSDFLLRFAMLRPQREPDSPHRQVVPRHVPDRDLN